MSVAKLLSPLKTNNQSVTDAQKTAAAFDKAAEEFVGSPSDATRAALEKAAAAMEKTFDQLQKEFEKAKADQDLRTLKSARAQCAVLIQDAKAAGSHAQQQQQQAQQKDIARLKADQVKVLEIHAMFKDWHDHAAEWITRLQKGIADPKKSEHAIDQLKDMKDIWPEVEKSIREFCLFIEKIKTQGVPLASTNYEEIRRDFLDAMIVNAPDEHLIPIF